MQIEQETALGAYAPLMLEHVPAGIALFDAHELRLLAANSRYQDLLEPQWQHGHALGHRLIEFLPRAAYTEIAALFRKVLETGVSSRMEGSPVFPRSACTGRVIPFRLMDAMLVPHRFCAC